ncbi:hypothetical protein B5M09_013811 [Aphanomyces astaci]|uniref:Mediator complex subunit 15 KIX domain-containing protein n=1 Tax=Aphanomyces astaci TaxID=112090 RepID=A0A3R7Y5A2_APHAT|nr:hypothetical protein B5M09_013811 [Aphanomyces astaci]
MVRRCSQLLRLHRGDKEQLQQTVMKYERAVWTKSADKEAYLKTLKAKMLTFKQQPTPNDATPVSPMVMLPANGDMSVPASPQVKQMETTTLMDAARQLQMTMLQLQHDMARNNLMQHHMNQQNNLIQHHYQQLLALANQEISI